MFPMEGPAQWEHAGRQRVPGSAQKRRRASLLPRCRCHWPVNTVQALAKPGVVPFTGLTIHAPKIPQRPSRARSRDGGRRIFAPIRTVAGFGRRSLWLEHLRNFLESVSLADAILSDRDSTRASIAPIPYTRMYASRNTGNDNCQRHLTANEVSRRKHWAPRPCNSALSICGGGPRG
jgi:hypothetical protein